MNIEQLNGKLEGLAQAVAALIANLEIMDAINGPDYCQYLYEQADHMQRKPGYQHAETVRGHALALHNLAATLDRARQQRAQADA